MDNLKVVEKIKNLMNKTEENGSTPEEAMSAALMAQKLMLKYDISVEDVDNLEDKTEEIVIEETEEKYSKYGNKKMRIVLANTIGLNFRCQAIGIGNIIAFVGKKSDAKIARITYNAMFYIMEKTAYKLYREAKDRNIYNSYMQGFVAGLHNKFETQKQEEGLIVVRPEKEIQDYLSNFNVKNQEIKDKTRNNDIDYGTYRKGYEDGQKDVDLNSLK